MVLGSDAPWDWIAASRAQRDAGELDADVCVLPAPVPEEGARFFLRGHIVLPLTEPVNGARSFAWSVWVSLTAESLALAYEHWDDADRALKVPPLFGWLASELPYEPSTLGLRTQVHTRPPGLVPLVEVDPSGGHPLAREQAEGISRHRVAELNAVILGGGPA
jgi:hypothetical protein